MKFATSLISLIPLNTRTNSRYVPIRLLRDTFLHGLGLCRFSASLLPSTAVTGRIYSTRNFHILARSTFSKPFRYCRFGRISKRMGAPELDRGSATQLRRTPFPQATVRLVVGVLERLPEVVAGKRSRRNGAPYLGGFCREPNDKCHWQQPVAPYFNNHRRRGRG
jgi:hypothetical protein